MPGRTPTFTIASLAVAAALVAGCSGSDQPITRAEPSGDDRSDVTVATTDTADATDATGTDEPSTTAGGTTTPTGPFVPEPMEWEPFNEAVETALFEVPVDYDDPDGPRFELFVARYSALDPDQRIGSLLVNPGGPGFGGSDFAMFAPQIFDRALLERFDIIGWDPRGTGESEPPIDCIDDYDPYFVDIDSTPDDDAERQHLVDVAEEFAQACVDNNADIIEFVGTNNSARDMDAIRQALGEDTISYFGFSYGSELGATWATLFPDTVRAAVLDGASDPEADSLESSLQQMKGFEASLSTFLARCSATSSCAFNNRGDAEGAYDELMVSLDQNPIVGEEGRPLVNRDVATTAVIQAMYSESYWPALERSLADAASGDGGGLLALNDAYYQRQSDGTYGNELEAFQTISCADTDERPTTAEVDAESELYHEAAPRLVPEGSAGGYFCTFFPPALEPRVAIDGAGAGPIVVIGTTGDPATPFDSTVRMSEILEDGRLVVVEADQHTGYGVNRCVIEVVNDYLIDLAAPESGTECR